MKSEKTENYRNFTTFDIFRYLSIYVYMSVKRPEGFFFENPKLCLGMYIHVVEPDVATPLGPVSLKDLSFGRKLVRLTHLVPEDTTA